MQQSLVQKKRILEFLLSLEPTMRYLGIFGLKLEYNFVIFKIIALQIMQLQNVECLSIGANHCKHHD